MDFYSFAIISSWKRAFPFFWITLNALPQGWFVANKSGENWLSGSREEDF
jgi:hypothetical protein